MEVIDAIMSRQSIRAFLDKEIPVETIQTILAAGTKAPSSGNKQPWRFIVVNDKDKIKEFDREYQQSWVINAPAVIIACANPHDSWEKYGEDDECWVLDTAAAIQHILLAVHGLGLGGVWVAMCSKRRIRELCGIPEHWRIVSIIPFGYFDKDDGAEFKGHTIKNTRPWKRKPLSEVAFINTVNIPFTG